MKKKIWNDAYWILRVFVITVVLIIIFSNIVNIESERIQQVIGAVLMFPAMWIDSLITKQFCKN